MAVDNESPFTVKELIEVLQKENQDAEIYVYFSEEINRAFPIMSLGGNSFSSGKVWIMTTNSWKQVEKY